MIGLGISVSLNQRQDAEQAQDLNKWLKWPYKPLPTGFETAFSQVASSDACYPDQG